MKIFLFVLFLALPFLSFSQTTTINYTESTADFPNPERGFYRYAATHSDSYSPLNATALAGYRNLHSPFSANYDIYSTLVYRVFYLDDFTNAAISNTYLTAMQADFDAARTAGVKLIVRFAYTNDVDGSSCANWICPPYGDASKTWVLNHINQLQPYLIANKDVISLIQMGFIGTWGEGYYTDYFGDASISPYILTANNWDDRTEVLNAYLAALPTDRMIQVRYPQAKQKAIYGNAAPTNSAPTSLAQAHNGSNISRIGHHNDCFLASYSDFGTYNNYGPPSSFADTTNLKPYLSDDSKFVPVGGETCSEYLPFDNCTADGGRADTELRRLHFSYLNSQYNNDVNNGWLGTCMDDIKKNLGYRFVLENGSYSNEAQAGQIISVSINLKNIGYAAPFNPRGVEIILRHTSTGNSFFATLNEDPRFWLTGSHTISHNLCLPQSIPNGDYELLLNLPDPEITLYNRAEYSIQLANNSVWEPSTGYNNLGHILTINNSATNTTCSTEIAFENSSSFLPVELNNFHLTTTTNNITCHWKTLSEMNNKGFNVQRSIDSKNWLNLKWIEGLGHSSTSQNYHFTDNNVEQNKQYYYRLEQIDFDESIQYSPIKTAKINNEKQLEKLFSITPNPASNTITIHLQNPLSSSFNIQVYDPKGALVLQEKINDFSRSEKSLDLNISSIPSGVFNIKIIDKKNIYTSRFIKLHP